MDAEVPRRNGWEMRDCSVTRPTILAGTAEELGIFSEPAAR